MWLTTHSKPTENLTPPTVISRTSIYRAWVGSDGQCFVPPIIVLDGRVCGVWCWLRSAAGAGRGFSPVGPRGSSSVTSPWPRRASRDSNQPANDNLQPTRRFQPPAQRPCAQIPQQTTLRRLKTPPRRQPSPGHPRPGLEHHPAGSPIPLTTYSPSASVPGRIVQSVPPPAQAILPPSPRHHVRPLAPARQRLGPAHAAGRPDAGRGQGPRRGGL